MSIKFIWDNQKADSNFNKHGISFEEAATVFTDPLSLTITDPSHSYNEERLIIIGQSLKNRLLIVIHTDLGNTIRIISARLATKMERKDYETGSDKLW